jgi:hypothetical protein
MPNGYEIFTRAIDLRRIILVRFVSAEKGIITRRCIPFDYATASRYHDGKFRYHMYDLDSPGAPHNVALLPEKIISLELTEETFDPKEYVTWKPDWHYQRHWNI